jgi:hypothetical protein
MQASLQPRGCLRLPGSGGEGRHLNQIIAVPHSDQTPTFS